MILCDEGSVNMVLRYKKLSQASASFTTLASSRANCHSREVWAHRVRFIVTSNRWWKELQCSAWEDAEWLRQNSLYVHVTEPLWL